MSSWERQGNAAMNLWQPEPNTAEHAYSQAILLDSTRAALYFGRARAHAEQDHHKEALSDLTKAIRLDSEYRQHAYSGRGTYFRGLTQLPEFWTIIDMAPPEKLSPNRRK